ncbi:uncharacterized protein LOC114828316 [Galendromus occidentalis]|uniref:Uncharacterized protein LOC114828316 n=1 Tax=Galendromus occidentalis TaxID=34638 RepID=A0AAJ7SFY8_9ACAR|nr:uncharacterized protein LOC114828316 [Galendromus occidentalis]
MRAKRAAVGKSEYRSAYRCISNQKRHDIWQENAEYRQERRRRDLGHESWDWDTNSSDEECTCGCGISNALVPYKDSTKSMGDLRLEEEQSSEDSSPRNSASTRNQPRSRFADKCVSTDDLASFFDQSTQTDRTAAKSVREKKRTPKVRFTAPADQHRRNPAGTIKSRPNSAVYTSEYQSNFAPIRF